MPLERLATLVGADVELVQATVESLRQRQIIVKHHVVINWNKVVEGRVMALIDIHLTPEREVGFDRVAERIARFPQVREVHLMSGAYDLSVLVTGDSLREVADFVSQRLATIDQVTNTTTHFMLRTYKDEGVLIEAEDEDPRLEVAP